MRPEPSPPERPGKAIDTVLLVILVVSLLLNIWEAASRRWAPGGQPGRSDSAAAAPR